MSTMQPIPWAGGQLLEVDGAPTWLYDGRVVVGWRLGPVVVNDQQCDPAEAESRWEVDEVEHTAVIDAVGGGSVRISLRHSLDRTWNVRVSVVNTGPETIRIDRLGIEVTVGADRVGWADRAGAEATIAVLPQQVGDPLIGFSLLQGEVRGRGADAELGPLTLPVGGQHVVRLRGEPYGSAREFARGRDQLLPAAQWAEVGDEIRIHHSDLAVVEATSITPPEDPDDPDVTTLIGEAGDTARLVLAGPRGLVDVEVGFAPALDLLVDRFVQTGERHWPPGRQGIRIPSAAAALVVQHQLASQLRGRRPAADWAEAVEGVCARLAEPTSVFAVALLARQAALTGDPDLAERATAGHRGSAASVGGLALVAPEVLAARQLTGLAPAPLRGALERRDGGSVAQSRGDLQLLGARLGLGLRGERLGSDDPVADAQALADARLRSLLETPRPHGWACGHDELIARHDRRLRHRLWAQLTDAVDDPTADPWVAETLAWLVLAPVP